MERRYYYRPWKDETLVSALHFLRCRTAREGGDLGHVDALLLRLGVDPATLPMPRPTPKHFARGKLRIAIMEALRDGPMTGADLARRVQGNGLDYADAYRKVYAALHRLKAARHVIHKEVGQWALPPQRAACESRTASGSG